MTSKAGWTFKSDSSPTTHGRLSPKITTSISPIPHALHTVNLLLFLPIGGGLCPLPLPEPQLALWLALTKRMWQKGGCGASEARGEEAWQLPLLSSCHVMKSSILTDWKAMGSKKPWRRRKDTWRRTEAPQLTAITKTPALWVGPSWLLHPQSRCPPGNAWSRDELLPFPYLPSPNLWPTE